MSRPADVQAEARALFGVIQTLFLKVRPGSTFITSPAVETAVVAKLVQKIESGWTPKKGWRTATISTPKPTSGKIPTPPTAPVVPSLDIGQARELLGRAVRAWAASGAAEGYL